MKTNKQLIKELNSQVRELSKSVATLRQQLRTGNLIDPFDHELLKKRVTRYKDALLIIHHSQNAATLAWDIADSALRSFNDA